MLALALIGCVRSGGADVSSAGDSTTRGGELTRASFSELDESADGLVDEHELWRESLRYYERWDADEDGRLTRAELDVGTFESWDRDDDQYLGRTEFEAGAREWLSREARTWSRWDVDGNELLDRDEVREGLAGSGLFDTFDADRDGTVTDAEVNGAWLAHWDRDRDRTIDEREWRAALSG